MIKRAAALISGWAFLWGLSPLKQPAAAQSESTAASSRQTFPAATPLSLLRDLLRKAVVQESFLRESLNTAQNLQKQGAAATDLSALTVSLHSIRENIDSLDQEAKAALAKIRISSGGPRVNEYARVLQEFGAKIQNEAALLQKKILHLSPKPIPRIRVKGRLRDAPGPTIGHSAEPPREAVFQELSEETSRLKASSNQLAAAAQWLQFISR